MKNWKEEIKIEAQENNCEEIEVYCYADETHRQHTDFIKFVCFGGDREFDSIPENAIDSYEIMGEEEYDNTICANTSGADFDEWFNNKDAKIMVVMLNSGWDDNE